MPLIQKEIAPPMLFGASDPEIVLVGWGSTYGVIREVVQELSGRQKIAMLHFSEIFPFPGTDVFDYLSLLRNAKKSICIEQNATSQFARLMRAETGFAFSETINRFDGRPFTVEDLLGELHVHIG